MLKLLRSAAVLSVLAGAACSDSLGPGDVDGTYVLRTVNGVAVPATFTDAGETIEFVAGEIVLRTDESYSLTLHVIETFQGVPQEDIFVSDGSYSLDGRDITFEDPTLGGALSGRISGESIVFDDPDFRLVFTR